MVFSICLNFTTRDNTDDDNDHNDDPGVSAVHGVQRDDPLRHLVWPLPGRHLPAEDQSHAEEGQVRDIE